MTDDKTSVRLNKHLALVLGISRREADDLIEQGRVTLTGEVARLGAQVSPPAEVQVDGKPIAQSQEYTYLLFNKPVGYVCSRRQQGDNPTIYSVLPKKYHRLKPVGRLDKDSSGIILLTNDGDFAYQMTHPQFRKVKIYEVQLDHSLEPLHQQMISDYGVMLEDGKSQFLISKGGAHPSASLRNESEASAPPPKARLTPRASARSTVEPLATSSEETSAGRVSPDAGALAETRPEAVFDDDGGEKAMYTITMHEGRNRQIRRTFAALGYAVKGLHRSTFGNYSLGDIKPGEFEVTVIR